LRGSCQRKLTEGDVRGAAALQSRRCAAIQLPRKRGSERAFSVEPHAFAGEDAGMAASANQLG
jgi:hypothetical protein